MNVSISCSRSRHSALRRQLPLSREQLTYAQLDTKADQLAHRLQAVGIATGVPVGICLDFSLEMPVALLGILKAGAPYVPLDAMLPRERLAFMATDSGVRLIAAHRHLAHALPETVPILWVDDAEGNDSSPRARSVAVGPDHLIHPLHLGLDGATEGVAMPHRAIVNLAAWHDATLLRAARVLQYAPLGFDASIHEMIAAWVSRGTIVLIQTTCVATSPPSRGSWRK